MMTANAPEAALPRPGDKRIDDLDDPFWEACRHGRLLLHRCETCGRFYWPASSCTVDGPAAMKWVEASGSGTIHTFVVVERTHDPIFAQRVPYNAAVVKLDEGVLFHSSIVGCRPDELEIGRKVAVVFDELSPGEVLPRFRLSEEGESP